LRSRRNFLARVLSKRFGRHASVEMRRACCALLVTLPLLLAACASLPEQDANAGAGSSPRASSASTGGLALPEPEIRDEEDRDERWRY
jgi:hypothetical protein